MRRRTDATPPSRPGVGAPLPDDLWRLSVWRHRLSSDGAGSPWPELAAVAVVAAYNPLVNRVIPDELYVPANLVVSGALVWLAKRSGATADDLGLRAGRVRRGVAVGLKGAVVAIAGIGVAAVLPWTRAYLADDRFVGVAWTEMLYQTLGRIPLGTAVGEEIIFRGVALGLLLRRLTVGGAVAASSVLFGLWHILPTLAALDTNPAGDVFGSGVGAAAAGAGAVLTTTIAGVGFSWLRFRASSVLAPVLVHAAVNSAAYLAGWLVVRNGWAV